MSDTATDRPPRYAVVFTGYGWDRFHDEQVQRHAARTRAGDIHVLVDESRGAIPVPSAYTKTSASEVAARALGLRIAYLRTLFWHNLDYLYYIFFDRFPDYDYYIFLDYDAVVQRDYDDLIGEVHRLGLDFVGSPVGGSLANWTYFEAHAPLYDPARLQACISAVTVLSNRALEHLSRRRKLDSAAPSPQQRAFWPFCEAFVPTELALAGFSSADLAAFGDAARFAWWPPTLDEALGKAGEHAFVHPVLDRPRFIASMLRHSRTRDFLMPRSRLWRAILTCPDRRWAVPFVREAARRLRRILVSVADHSDVVAVGMQPLRSNAGETSPIASSARCVCADRPIPGSAHT